MLAKGLLFILTIIWVVILAVALPMLIGLLQDPQSMFLVSIAEDWMFRTFQGRWEIPIILAIITLYYKNSADLNSLLVFLPPIFVTISFVYFYLSSNESPAIFLIVMFALESFGIGVQSYNTYRILRGRPHSSRSLRVGYVVIKKRVSSH